MFGCYCYVPIAIIVVINLLYSLILIVRIENYLNYEASSLRWKWNELPAGWNIA